MNIGSCGNQPKAPATAYRFRSEWATSSTVVSAVATATEPYKGQRRFHVSTSSWA